MLSAAFEWLDAHPAFYWWLAIPATLLLVGRIALVVVASARREESRAGGPAFDAICLLLFLLAWRWPFLLSAEEYNPDESQFIAGALTLAQDPVFFRSVDGTTSGPLNFYALLPLHWLGLPLDYFSARLAAILLNWGALVLTFRTLAARFGPGVAWVGIAPAAAMLGTAWQGEFVHYSSELVPVVLLAGSTHCLLRTAAPRRSALWVGCVLAGLAPWAKLQAAPLAAVLVGWALLLAGQNQAANRARALAGVLLAAVAPSLVIVGLIVLFGQADSAWHRYFLQNFVYVDQGRPIATALGRMFGFALRDQRILLYLGLTGLSAAALVAALLLRRVPRPSSLGLAAGLLAAAVFALVAPRREILHYTIFLIAPLALLFGSAFGAWWQQRRGVGGRLALAAVLLAATAGPLLVTRLFQPVPEMFGQFAAHWRHPRRATSEMVHALARGQGHLAVWGYAQWLYVETGLPQATRDALNVRSIEDDPMRAYFRAEYLADLRRNRPGVFVDVVGTDGYLYQDRTRQGHESFPALAEEIRTNYVLVHASAASRIYLRRDHPRLEEVGAEELAAAARRGRRASLVPEPDFADPPPAWELVDHSRVLFLHPPAQARWSLSPDIREVVVEFGMMRESYLEGTSNGAALVVELANDAYSQVLLRRLLRPREVEADRARQTVRLTLPPFGPGTRLVVRSDPGDGGDAAWDWLFVSRLGWRRHPHFLAKQFPGYNRVPESVETWNATLMGDGRERELGVHPPAKFRFRLNGGERTLRFRYGIHPGAYEDGGRTDGATFIVKVLRDGVEPRVIFTDHVNPLEDPTDRGTQSARVDLAGVTQGDLLELELTAGPSGNGAWDWTFLRQVRID